MKFCPFEMMNLVSSIIDSFRKYIAQNNGAVGHIFRKPCTVGNFFIRFYNFGTKDFCGSLAETLKCISIRKNISFFFKQTSIVYISMSQRGFRKKAVNLDINATVSK
jgi:hypothetical protein